MLLNTRYAIALWLLLCTAIPAQAADQASPEASASPSCTYSVESAPKTVQDTLTPAYADGSKVDLKEVAERMKLLMNEIANCQAVAQEPGNDAPTRNHDIGEWLSLNQWMYRLTMFVDQNARGDHHMDWKREFETFVDVYELKH